MALFSTVNILPQRSPSGFRPWEYIPTALRIKNESTQQVEEKFELPYGEIPSNVLPSSKFYIFSPVSHCTIGYSWTTRNVTQDALPLATVGGITGALASLAIAGDIAAERGLISLRLGTSTPPPTVGYSIGDLYSERMYWFLVAIKNDLTGNGIITKSNSDVLQRYRLKRFYLHHGEITNSSSTESGLAAGETAINLGITIPLNKNIQDISLGGIIVKKGGKQVSISIKRFLSNFNAVIDIPKDIADMPTTGDFYILDKIICIEDPYLMGGLFIGRESDPYIFDNSTESGLNTLNTDNNRAYIDTYFSGGYALKNTTTGAIIGGSVGASMNDSDETTWIWANNGKDSDIYEEKDKRFRKTTSFIQLNKGWRFVAKSTNTKEISIDDYDRYYPEYQLREIGQIADVTAKAIDNTVQHIRVELARGGNIRYNNFHAPILKNEYIIQNNKYFKILDQLDGTILDVSYTSVDGTSKLDINEKISIINQFSWKIAEHYIENDFPLEATVDRVNVEDNSIELSLYETILSPALRPIGGGTTQDINKKLPYMEKNSFLFRFLNTFPHSTVDSPIKMYEKGDRWVIENTSLTSALNVNSMTYLGETSGQHRIKVYLDAEPNSTDFPAGFPVILRFDQPFVKNSTFLGGASINATDATSAACIGGNFTSPVVELKIPNGTAFGICDNYLWGLSTGAVSLATPFFITTPEGLTTISSCFCNVPVSEAVLYKDAATGKATLRQGFLNYKEEPIKQEIAMGLKQKEVVGGSGELMSLNYERLNGIFVDGMAAATSNKDIYITLSIGNKKNIYGFPVTGKGNLDLQALRISGEAVPEKQANNPNSIFATDITDEGQIVSPVYVYKPNVLHQRKTAYIPFGANTDRGAIYINEGVSETDASGSMTGYYVNNNQTIDATGAIDVFLMRDGEKIVIYNKIIDYDFYIDEKLNESGWKYSDSVIMITGSQNFGDSWGAPFLSQGKLYGSPTVVEEDSNGVTYLPLLLAFACEYLGGVYDRLRHLLYIFVRGNNDEGVPFLGVFIIQGALMFKNIHYGYHKDLKGKNYFDATVYKDSDMPFLYRPLNLPEAIRSNEDKYFTSPKNVMNFDSSKDKNLNSDYFVRIMGSSLTKSNILESETSWGAMSFNMLETGQLLFFYDSPVGIQFGFSNDSGRTWNKSEIIVSKKGKCGFMIDNDWVYYLVPGKGIYLKQIYGANLQQIMQLTLDKKKGKTNVNVESFQKTIDIMPEIDIGTGVINEQRFSGYRTHTGLYKIFYYDVNSSLACRESQDGLVWKAAANF